jgi:glucosamine--fructose-6-phosphate aminotransferase (isomerizing)
MSADTPPTSTMLAEARAMPGLVRAQLAEDKELYRRLAASLRVNPPAAVATLARGSSEHAARYLGFLVSSRLGILVSRLLPSLLTLYRAPLKAEGLLAIAVSQSGQSPDLLEPVRAVRAGGGTAVAMVNDAASPLAAEAGWVLPLRAGPELAVPATKSFVASLAAAARLVGHWCEDARLLRALEALPAAIDEGLRQDWSAAAGAFVNAERMYVVSRGLGLPLALETALKLKEACGIQGEAFSAAEIRHGPMCLVGPGYPVLVLALRGPALADLVAFSEELRRQGAKVVLAAPADVRARDVTFAVSEAEELDPAAAVASVYPMVDALARARGRDPDRPPNLSKVMATR